MNFQEAFKFFIEGKKIRRKCWLSDTTLLCVNSDNDFTFGERLYGEDEDFFSVEDVLAIDWEIV